MAIKSVKTSNKILLQDKDGNKYYPHTMADVVHVDETKTIGDWVSTKETQLTQAQTNATTQANYAKTQGDYAKVQGGQIEAIATTIQDKVKINGAQTNVNFIRNEIVKDGLVEIGSYDTTKDFTLIVDFVPQINDVDLFTIGHSTTGGMQFVIVGEELRFRTCENGSWATRYTIGTVSYGKRYTFCVIKANDIKLLFDNKLISMNKNYYTEGVHIYNKYKYLHLLYNRILTTQEINHNFNVLLNSQSINKINDYVIASDTDHVTDSGSILQSKINRVFYKQNCKEFTSSGTDITVNNGLDGYVLSGKIEGQTVKNVVNSINKFTLTTSNRTFNVNIKAGMEYTFIFNITKNTKLQTSFFAQVAVFGACNIGVGEAGKKIVKVTALVDADSVVIGVRDSSSDTELTIEDYVILAGDFTTNCPIKSHIPFGLNSTQATITNNGLKYSFYASEEDKLAGKVIELPFAEDTIMLNEDGSLTLLNNGGTEVLNGTENWTISSDENLDFNVYRIASAYAKYKGNINIDCNLYNFKYDTTTKGNIMITDISGHLYITDDKMTIEQFKAKLSLNNVYFKTLLKQPTVTHIDKSLVPTILTQATNTFTFGDAVAPSKVTIQAPVNRIAEMQAEINEIKALIQTPSNMNLTMNYIEDEYNKNQNAKGEM